MINIGILWRLPGHEKNTSRMQLSSHPNDKRGRRKIRSRSFTSLG
jgi:hypothetical protein